MSQQDKQFEKLFNILDQNEDYEVNTPFKTFIKESILGAGFCPPEQPQKKDLKEVKKEKKDVNHKKKDVKVKVKKERKVSGYNLFVGDQIKQLKEYGVPAENRLGEAAGLWKQLDEKEKGVWKEKAKVINEDKEKAKQ